jgi:hypothetical protein
LQQVTIKKLTLFAIPVVVAVSDLIVEQYWDMSRRYLGVLVLALKVGNLLLEGGLVLFRQSRGRNLNFLSS